MAAIFAAESNRHVVLLERTKDGGRKILISGGGRCNVLPSRLSPTQYFTDSSPNTLKKMLLSWPLAEQRAFFERSLNIPLKLEEESGKLFPVSDKARDVRDALIRRARERGADIRFEQRVTNLEPCDGGWRVSIDGRDTIEARKVIVATGGLSVPQTGSDGTGLRIMQRLGHTIHPTYPALTPLTCNPPRYAELAGISLEVTLEALQPKRFTTTGGFLFTHRGYSGPTVLNISHIAIRTRLPIYVQWTALDVEAWDARLLQGGSATVGGIVRKELPARLADMLISAAQVDPQRMLSALRKDERARLVEALAHFQLPWTGDEGYKKAEVTGGGVALNEVDTKTMESKLHAGLYLCGEILDAFGPIGGYNFAWGWATGRAAGIAAGSMA